MQLHLCGVYSGALCELCVNYFTATDANGGSRANAAII